MANMKLKSIHCVVLGNVVYVHSPILGILWNTLLSLTIPIKCDVLHVLHDGMGYPGAGGWETVVGYQIVGGGDGSKGVAVK